jgi:hypothetical protein
VAVAADGWRICFARTARAAGERSRVAHLGQQLVNLVHKPNQVERRMEPDSAQPNQVLEFRAYDVSAPE